MWTQLLFLGGLYFVLRATFGLQLQVGGETRAITHIRGNGFSTVYSRQCASKVQTETYLDNIEFMN